MSFTIRISLLYESSCLPFLSTPLVQLVCQLPQYTSFPINTVQLPVPQGSTCTPFQLTLSPIPLSPPPEPRLVLYEGISVGSWRRLYRRSYVGYAKGENGHKSDVFSGYDSCYPEYRPDLCMWTGTNSCRLYIGEHNVGGETSKLILANTTWEERRVSDQHPDYEEFSTC